MKNKGILILLIMLVIVSIPSISEADSKITMKVNGEVVTSDVDPFIENGRTYVPVRFIAEHLGMDVDWREDGDHEDSIIVTIKGEKGREIWINIILIVTSDGIYYHEFDEDSYTPTYILRKDRTFVPIRSIANALNLNILWDQDTRTVTLSTNYRNDIYPVYYSSVNEYGGVVYTRASFDLEFRNDQYMIRNQDKTIEDYLTILYSGNSVRHNITPYDESTKNEIEIYGNTNFVMSPYRDAVVGMMFN